MRFLKRITTLLQTSSPEFKRRLFVIVGFLIILNVGMWIVTGIANQHYPIIFGLVVLAYGLGLRHAVDADHIAAIDNTTRKLMIENKKPLAVGLFFSLGHATIVVILSIIVAFSASFIQHNLPAFKETGSFIGTFVSSFFLLTIGIINLMFLIDIFKLWRNVVTGRETHNLTIHDHLHVQGFLAKIFKPFLKTVTKSYHMYFVGFLFGLGFDTASEVGLLSISAATGAKGMPLGYVFLLPIAFTAGMCLIDTLDGIFMLAAYGWAYVKPIRKLYYNLNITLLSVVIALFIGGIEAMQLIINKLHLTGTFLDTIARIDFGNFGYIIIAMFVISWLVSIGIYKIRRYDLLENNNK